MTTTMLHPGHGGVSPAKALHITLWITQIALAAAFFLAGIMKLTAPMDELRAAMPWVHGEMGDYVRLIGTLEVLGALGLILPAATRIRPALTIVAATGLAILMAGAVLTHLTRDEADSIGPALTLGALSAFAAWGRSKKVPIPPRRAESYRRPRHTDRDVS